MSNLADIIAQETQDGRLIVRFLISSMRGELPDFQPCHRLDAARLLVKLGFDQAQTFISQADPHPQRDPRSPGQPPPQFPDPDRSLRSQLAQIVREETQDGLAAVLFLIDVMQGQLPNFKPGHRLSAAKELLHRGFDYAPENPDALQSAEPEPDPAQLEAQRRHAEDIESSLHSPAYYDSDPRLCACEDRLHDCKGNLLNDQQREKVAREGPGMQFFIGDPHKIDAFLARYADYLDRRNAENPDHPVDINRICWLDKRWQHLNHIRDP